MYNYFYPNFKRNDFITILSDTRNIRLDYKKPNRLDRPDRSVIPINYTKFKKLNNNF